jgi:hypothetical protein
MDLLQINKEMNNKKISNQISILTVAGFLYNWWLLNTYSTIDKWITNISYEYICFNAYIYLKNEFKSINTYQEDTCKSDYDLQLYRWLVLNRVLPNMDFDSVAVGTLCLKDILKKQCIQVLKNKIENYY